MRDQFNLGGDFRSATINIQAAREGRPDRLGPEAAWAKFAELPLDQVPDRQALPPGSVLPWPPNPLFVARNDDLISLAKTLAAGGGAAICQTAAVSGLGGIGKTQLAVEFAHRYGGYFAGGVFWVHCGDPKTIPTQIAACGGAGGLNLRDDFGDLSLPDQVAFILEAWRAPYPRLLIFDNCETEEILAAWRPLAGGARVLVTSRRAKWSAALGMASQTLSVLARADSLRLLGATASHPAQARSDLAAIAAELGDLPLALQMAAAFMARYRHADLGRPDHYLARLRALVLDHPSMVQGEWSPTGHEQHVARTFAVGYDDLDPKQPADAGALDILGLLSSYAPGEFIPRHFITAFGDAGESEEDLELGKEEAFRRLADLGLIEDRGEAVVVHRLVAVFVHARQGPEPRDRLEADVLFAASAANAEQDPRLITDWEVHLLHIAETALSRGSALAPALLREIGVYRYQQGDYPAATQAHKRRLDLLEAAEPKNDAAIGSALNDYAVALRPLQPAQALALLRRAMALAEALQPAAGRTPSARSKRPRTCWIAGRDLSPPATICPRVFSSRNPMRSAPGLSPGWWGFTRSPSLNGRTPCWRKPLGISIRPRRSSTTGRCSRLWALCARTAETWPAPRST